jgi:hypothetical protein
MADALSGMLYRFGSLDALRCALTGAAPDTLLPHAVLLASRGAAGLSKEKLKLREENR